jgi:hypothetical protein
LTRAWFLVGLVLALAACDTRAAMEPALRFELSRAELDIAEAERAAATGADPTFACAAVKQMIAGLEREPIHTVRATVARGRRVCRTATLGFANAQLARLEAARPGGERERLASECVDLLRSVALLEALVPGDEEVAELARKRKTLCP